jgi:hypothetical protein
MKSNIRVKKWYKPNRKLPLKKDSGSAANLATNKKRVCVSPLDGVACRSESISNVVTVTC